MGRAGVPLTARDWGTDSRSVIPTRGALGRGCGGVVGWSGGGWGEERRNERWARLIHEAFRCRNRLFDVSTSGALVAYPSILKLSFSPLPSFPLPSFPLPSSPLTGVLSFEEEKLFLYCRSLKRLTKHKKNASKAFSLSGVSWNIVYA